MKYLVVTLFLSLLISCDLVNDDEVENSELNNNCSCTQDDMIADYIYDFDNGEFDWSGTANSEIIDNQLVLTSVKGYRWHTIDYSKDTHFTKGRISFDFQPQNGRYSFETKGWAKTNQFSLGIYTYFKNDTIYVRSQLDSIASLISTGKKYNPFEWYQVELEFDSEAGSKGEYDFWISSLQDCTSKTHIGTFEYDAKFGALIGVNQFSLGVGDVDLENEQNVIFDNIQFWIE